MVPLPEFNTWLVPKHPTTGFRLGNHYVIAVTAKTDTSETPESIPAYNTFVDYHRSVLCKMAWWTELQRKSSSSDGDFAASQKRKVSTDKELEKPVVGFTTMVLSDFLPPSQLKFVVWLQFSTNMMCMIFYHFPIKPCGYKT